MFSLGSFATTQNAVPSGAPFTAASAENGCSVDPSTFRIVLGNNVGSFDAVLLNDRDIPGASGVGMPQGKFGVGFPGNVVGGAIQNLLANTRFDNNENVEGTFFAQLISVPVGNNLIGTCIPVAAQNDLDFTSGHFTSGIGTRVAVFKGTNIVRNNDGTKTVPPIVSFLTGFLPLGALRLTDVVGVKCDSPDNTFAATGAADRIIGLHVAPQNTLTTVAAGQLIGILQEGATDLNIIQGIPARTAASDVVVREQGTNIIKRIVGASGSFTTVDLKTVTVVDGVITSIV
jgi:hypothetical protein